MIELARHNATDNGIGHEVVVEGIYLDWKDFAGPSYSAGATQGRGARRSSGDVYNARTEAAPSETIGTGEHAPDGSLSVPQLDGSLVSLARPHVLF